MRASISASASISRLRQASARRAERAGKLAHRLRALRLGLGEHEVAKPLDGGEIEPPVGKRAARELARLRGPKARQLAEAASTAATTARPPCRCSSAMSSAVSVFGPGNQTTSASSMQRVAVAQPAQRRAPRLGQLAAERGDRIARARPGDAHHRDRGRRAAGGEGEDGGGGDHSNKEDRDSDCSSSLRSTFSPALYSLCTMRRI